MKIIYMPVNTNKSTETNRIFIADEEPLVCELMQYNLEQAGYNVGVYHTTSEAMDSELTDFDLYIIDVMMEDKEGFELARYLKQNLETLRTPLIFCSSRNNEDDVINGLDLGADDYILKPFAMKELVARVNSIMRRRRITLNSAGR